MKKLYWVKRYVTLGVEKFVYANSPKEAEHFMDNAGVEATEYIDDHFDSHEVAESDLQYIQDSDIMNPEDKE